MAKDSLDTRFDDTRPFPIQQGQPRRIDGQGLVYPPSCSIPMWLAEAAYKVYAEKYRTSQTLQRLGERGGFGRGELLWLLRGGNDKDWPETNRLLGDTER